ncbi:hypothetical protein BD769DRAFT_1099946 [Suillus cothurnatus]|nr:hypothetical protein BD769DRAFT_1099946 [Suillus cothurnatus]
MWRQKLPRGQIIRWMTSRTSRLRYIYVKKGFKILMQTLPQWKLNTKTSYRIIPVSGCDDPYPIIRVGGGRYQLHSPPFHTLPDLECHIASPYAVINAGPKCVGRGLTEIARICDQSAAKAWVTGQKELLKRKRKHDTNQDGADRRSVIT